jgi:flap endonuclease GEN
MTVASLWKALDRAGCGKAVGTKELRDHNQLKEKTTTWNFSQMEKSVLSNRPVLAIDLSIWICEALTSTAMAENHADPTLHLVYTRTLKLLNLGVKLVAVIEGKRRIRRTDGGEDGYQKRRSGTAFWRACQRCEEMLRMLGVPVVRAKAEGEALCALLNQRGIVDGVISNDGDCLLFGAKILYTKFSIENLEHSRVMRYDASDIRAFVDDDDNDEYDMKGGDCKDNHISDIVNLSRNDLIAFAILTGSDVAGNGLSKVGCRKALRFIRKCQIDNPMRPEAATIDELNAWAKAATAADNSSEQEPVRSGQCCSCCCHPGSKSTHLKHGCKLCGTNPGEPCFRVSPGGRFRKSLRAKALAMKPKFDPASIVKIYQQPNENQLPLDLIRKNARNLEMMAPQLQKMLQSSFIIRGRSFAESREYLQKSLSRFLARTELFSQMSKVDGDDRPKKLPANENIPVPQQIKKSMVRAGAACFEVQWIVEATTTDSDGQPIDEFEFSTVEEQHMIKKCYPQLIERFEEEAKERMKQGDTEQERRHAFLDSMCSKLNVNPAQENESMKKWQSRRNRRGGFFARERPRPVVASNQTECASDDLGGIMVGLSKQTGGIDRKLSAVEDAQLRRSFSRQSIVTNVKSGHLTLIDSKNEQNIRRDMIRPTASSILTTEPVQHNIGMDQSNLSKKNEGSNRLTLVHQSRNSGDDVNQLLRFIEHQQRDDSEFDFSSIDTASLTSLSSDSEKQMDPGETLHSPVAAQVIQYSSSLTAGHIHFLGSNQEAPKEEHRFAQRINNIVESEVFSRKTLKARVPNRPGMRGYFASDHQEICPRLHREMENANQETGVEDRIDRSPFLKRNRNKDTSRTRGQEQAWYHPSSCEPSLRLFEFGKCDPTMPASTEQILGREGLFNTEKPKSIGFHEKRAIFPEDRRLYLELETKVASQRLVGLEHLVWNDHHIPEDQIRLGETAENRAPSSKRLEFPELYEAATAIRAEYQVGDDASWDLLNHQSIEAVEQFADMGLEDAPVQHDSPLYQHSFENSFQPAQEGDHLTSCRYDGADNLAPRGLWNISEEMEQHHAEFSECQTQPHFHVDPRDRYLSMESGADPGQWEARGWEFGVHDEDFEKEIVQKAVQKLESKQRQARLDLECSKHFEALGWAGQTSTPARNDDVFYVAT